VDHNCGGDPNGEKKIRLNALQKDFNACSTDNPITSWTLENMVEEAVKIGRQINEYQKTAPLPQRPIRPPGCSEEQYQVLCDEAEKDLNALAGMHKMDHILW
jgi:hypothetical protein